MKHKYNLFLNTMASENQTGDTQSKPGVSITCAVTKKTQVCVVCGKRTESSKHRVMLFKNDQKTEACKLIEKYLETELIPDNTVNCVCQNCRRSLNTIQSQVKRHKQKFEKSAEQFKKSLSLDSIQQSTSMSSGICRPG